MQKLNLIFENTAKTKTECLQFEIYDTESARKVMELLKMTKNTTSIVSRNDVRRSHNGETTLGYATELNRVIYEINELDESCFIDDSLKLDLAVPAHEQVAKLNQLHEIFQLYTEKWGVRVNETQELLERVNILVHLMEAAPVEIDQVFMVARQVGDIPKSLDLEMTEEDHMNRMPHADWGVLEMDYSTVGKDLGACYWTNDVRLVKEGNLRQQTHLAPAVAVNFMHEPENKPTKEVDQRKMDTYYKWCADNNIGDYVNYKLPLFRLGRMRLGEIDRAFTMQQILDLSLYYPNAKEIIIYDK